MSCVEDLEKKYPAFVYSVRGGAVLEKTRIGVIYLRRMDLIPIQYFNVNPKRLKLKISVSLSYVGLYPLASYTCWCGGGIYKIAVFVKNPFKQIQDLMNTIVMMGMLLQAIGLLSSLTTMFM
jgi:hypothetical protein